MGILNTIFGGAAKDLVDSVGGILDNTFTNDAKKMAAKEKLTSVIMGAFDKLQTLQAAIISKEATGNWLQRSWRPLVMLAFAFVVVYAFFIQPAFLPNSISVRDELPEEFWGLLKIGIGGYVVGRSVEKIANTVTRNIDLPFLKKKDRKER
jgi:hypothetical protein